MRGLEAGMSAEGEVTVYLCPRCLTADERPGLCPRCQIERVKCEAGAPEDARRRPVVDASGQVRSRAPLWWLRQTVSQLAEYWINE